MELIFLKPYYLLFLWVLPILILLHFLMSRHSRRKAIHFSNFSVLKRVSKKYSFTNTIPLLVLRIIILALLVFTIADMRIVYEAESDFSNYVIAIDASVSMLADDLGVTRFEIAKNLSKFFIDNLNFNSKVGFITFSSVVEIESVLTEDKELVNDLIFFNRNIKNTGTNIGAAIFTGVNILSSEDSAKNIILFSDGQSNTGISVSDAVSYAIKNNVKIDTIGLGNEVGGNIGGIDSLFKYDDLELRQIANFTGGKYFNVKNAGIKDISKDLIEKSVQKIYLKLNRYLMISIFLSLLFEFVIVNIFYKIVP